MKKGNTLRKFADKMNTRASMDIERNIPFRKHELREHSMLNRGSWKITNHHFNRRKRRAIGSLMSKDKSMSYEKALAMIELAENIARS